MLAELAALGRRLPVDAPADPDIERALSFVGADADAETAVRAGYGAATVLAVLAAPVVALAPTPVRVPLAALALAGVLSPPAIARRTSLALAAARRTRALGAAPDLVARAVLRMRVEPTAERAATFAAETGDGPLAASLGEHVRRAAGTPGAGFTSFATEWADWNPSLRRAVLLVAAAADAPAGERERTLDRALAAVLSGTRDRMAEFVAAIRGPTTAIYAFGVLLPLALVAVLPAGRAAGLPVSPAALVVVYDLLLPAGLLGASAWLLARRPVAFPPPAVTRAHPDVPDGRWRVAAGALAVGATAFLAAPALLPAWTRWVAAAGSLAGTALVGWTRPVVAARERVRAVETHLADALYLVGRRVKEGTAVEDAVAAAAEEVAGETGDVLAAAARNQRLLRAGVREAFLGEHGALADVPSPRARSAAALLALAAREGRPAGSAIVSMADHLDDLREVEREARRELAQVTGTLRSTAAAFGPLVAGATVALARGMAGTGEFGGTVPTAALGLAVGAYVLLLATVVTALATGLERGVDRTLVGYRVGLSLLSATAVYLAAFAGASALT
ncbi:type II secretion system protein [halophilic archaeon]|nr:type II secretion system protein [halophilic archaeon]